MCMSPMYVGDTRAYTLHVCLDILFNRPISASYARKVHFFLLLCRLYLALTSRLGDLNVCRFPALWGLRYNHWLIVGSPKVKVEITGFLSGLRSKSFETGDLRRALCSDRSSSVCLLRFFLSFLFQIPTRVLLTSSLSFPSRPTDSPAPATPPL